MRMLDRDHPQEELSEVLLNHEDFLAGLTLCGRSKPMSNKDYGQLPRHFLGSFIGADYAIWSFDTPIAWYNPRAEAWEMPSVRYCGFTAKHQSKIRITLRLLREELRELNLP